ncbi:hypothetical protein FOMA001_g2592 [Fusarium oxysporum f. sp. matthiolae]|nr:hypothetical protein FOMA001_g2592 [Fusarium oxysporum f. sp. matthiolae]
MELLRPAEERRDRQRSVATVLPVKVVSLDDYVHIIDEW